MKVEAEMVSKGIRRTFMLALLIGGPIVGWLLNGDRGIMFGLATSVIAVAWFLLEQRRIV